MGHYLFKEDCVVVLSVADGIPNFGLIKCILFLKKYLFVVKLFQTVHYDDHFHAYSVVHSTKLIVVDLASLKDYVPLRYHSINYEGVDQLFISLRHVVFYIQLLINAHSTLLCRCNFHIVTLFLTRSNNI